MSSLKKGPAVVKPEHDALERVLRVVTVKGILQVFYIFCGFESVIYYRIQVTVPEIHCPEKASLVKLIH